jgi:NAD(P)H dehydrogenase (quinone)
VEKSSRPVCLWHNLRQLSALGCHAQVVQSGRFVRVFVVYAHPSEASFSAALHARALAALRARGHDVDDCDLYAESFDPLLSKGDFLEYNDIFANRRRVASYVERLLAAEALLLIYPVWNEGFPAILKGFLDRVFLPGVSFSKDPDGVVKPALVNISKLGALCTYGAGHLVTMVMGDPPRRVVKRLLRSMTTHHVRCDYLALYGMDRTTREMRASFLVRVDRVLAEW